MLGSLSRRTGSAGDEARRLGVELEGHGKILVAARHSPAADRVGGGFRAGGASRARRTGLGLAHGDVSGLLSRTRAVRKCAAFSWFERAKLGELVGRNPPPLRCGAARTRHVPAAKIFQLIVNRRNNHRTSVLESASHTFVGERNSSPPADRRVSRRRRLYLQTLHCSVRRLPNFRSYVKVKIEAMSISQKQYGQAEVLRSLNYT